MTDLVSYWGRQAQRSREWDKRFRERKKRQFNNGACAAIIADCDCDSCISNDVDISMRSWKPIEGTFYPVK